MTFKEGDRFHARKRWGLSPSLLGCMAGKAVEDLKNGNDKVIGFLVGQIMKKSGGKANPALAQKLIRERIK